MKQNNDDYQVVPYPKDRRAAAVLYRSVQRKPMIHGLIEVDVTRARAFLREHKAKTGESLSFTAFIATCLGKAVDENTYQQACMWVTAREGLLCFVRIMNHSMYTGQPTDQT